MCQMPGATGNMSPGMMSSTIRATMTGDGGALKGIVDKTKGGQGAAQQRIASRSGGTVLGGTAQTDARMTPSRGKTLLGQ